jgi:hypothetical protein
MLSMAFARSAARKLDTYSWSFFSSRANTLAVCRSMASTRFFSSSAELSLTRSSYRGCCGFEDCGFKAAARVCASSASMNLENLVFLSALLTWL